MPRGRRNEAAQPRGRLHPPHQRQPGIAGNATLQSPVPVPRAPPREGEEVAIPKTAVTGGPGSSSSSDDAGSSSALTALTEAVDAAAKDSASRSSRAATAVRVCSSSPRLSPERADGLPEDAPRGIGQRVERNGQWPHGRGVAPACQDHQDHQDIFCDHQDDT